MALRGPGAAQGRQPGGVTLVDRRNHHLFQPLLYQVATGALSPGEIAQPLRSIFRKQRNTRSCWARRQRIDPVAREVHFEGGLSLPYDTLIVATGARHSYFGHDDWAPYAPGLKTIDDATEIRRRILIAFEAAEREADPDRRREWMTFVLVGGGPTGVELAGALGEIANDTLRSDFRSIRPQDARIELIEAVDRILPMYPPDRSASAATQLARLGVTVRTRTRVVDIGESYVRVEDELARRRSAPVPSCGRRACSRRPSGGPWPRPRAPRPTGPAGSGLGNTSPSRDTRRSSW